MSLTVLHVHSGNLFGGVERMLETLAPATSGQSPIASSFALCFEGPVSDALQRAGGQLSLLGPVQARRPDSVWRARRRLEELFASRSWDLVCVHSSWSQAIFGPTVHKRRLPLVRWLHAPQPGPRWLEHWASRSPATLVLCNSRYTSERARPPLTGPLTAVQYPPAVLPNAGADDRAAVRAELGTAADAAVIVLAARLEAGKGHTLLVEALARLTVTNWEAWIVGGVQQPAEQAYLDSIQRLVDTAGLGGRIRFLGQRSDVARLLRAADVYCQPNQAPDSFGLSFIEALAAGLPVITSRLGAAPEIIDESCGILVAPGSADDVAHAITRLVQSGVECRSMALAARARAAEFCDLPRSLSQLASHLAQAVNSVSLALT